MSVSKSPPKSRLATHIVALPKSGIRDFFELVNSMEDVISLGVGEPNFVTPWHIRESTIFALEKGHTSYTSNLGLLSLRKEVCAYIARTRGVEYDPKTECIITVGVSEALDLAMRAILNPGDEMIYHEPCYVSYSPEIKMTHGIPVTVETREENAFTLEPADIVKVLTPKTKGLLLNFPCNPTGATLDERRMGEIADIAISRDLIVVSDEIYTELTYGERPNSIAALPGMRDRTLLLHGFSKAFAMTGYRMGFACGPFDLIDAMMKIHQYSMLCASRIAQEAAMEALRNGEKEMLRMKEQYHKRRDLIVKGLNEIGLACRPPEGAFYAFANIRSTGMSSMDFAMTLLKKHRVAVVPGTAFGACGEGYVRCAYAASYEDITEAVSRMREFVASIK